jgi:hypothetical protein
MDEFVAENVKIRGPEYHNVDQKIREDPALQYTQRPAENAYIGNAEIKRLAEPDDNGNKKNAC